MSTTATRQEKDSIGLKDIPAHVYYGVQTARAVENYPISGMRAHPTLIRAFGLIKKAAALANKELESAVGGILLPKIADRMLKIFRSKEGGDS